MIQLNRRRGKTIDFGSQGFDGTAFTCSERSTLRSAWIREVSACPLYHATCTIPAVPADRADDGCIIGGVECFAELTPSLPPLGRAAPNFSHCLSHTPTRVRLMAFSQVGRASLTGTSTTKPWPARKE